MNRRTRTLRIVLILAVMVSSLPLALAVVAAPPGVPVTTAATAIGWGANFVGELGANPDSEEPYPVPVGDLADITATGAGDDHSVFLRTGGTVMTVGSNEHGALGDGTLSGLVVTTPAPVVGVGGTGTLGTVIAVSVGSHFTLALRANGTVVAWGAGADGQLGINTDDDSGSPVVVRNPTNTGDLSGIIAIAAGCFHALALAGNGTVYAWGFGSDGQLGRGNYNSSQLPVVVRNPGDTGDLANIAVIGAGCYHSLAVANDGTVYGWGDNDAGELGNDAFSDTNLPVEALAPSGASGSNLGDVATITMLSGGYRHSVALATNGAVYAWGANYDGQVGNGSISNQNDVRVPTAVVGPDGTGTLTGIATVVAGDDHTVALTSTGQVYTWGANYDSQLGNGKSNTAGRGRPGLVLRPDGTPLAGVLAIGAGPDAYHTLVTIPPGTIRTASASPAALAFGGQQIGTQSPTKNVTFTNTGLADLTVSTTISGDFTKIIDLCPAMLPGGANCTIVVAFAPTATGARTGNLTITTDLVAPQVVALSGTGATSAALFKVVASASAGGTVSDAGEKLYTAGTTASYTATPADGTKLFVGWTLDGQYVSYANPLAFTMNGDHTLVATFATRPSFGDVPVGDADYQAITFLAALGIINPNGVNGSGNFEPEREVARAEVAAFIARVFDWDGEFHVNTFPDKCDAQGQNCVDDELWSNVAALGDYGVVGGYTDPATCTSVGTTAPCYLPRDVVKRVQVVSIVARAFTKAPHLRPTGYWDRLAPDPAQYTNVPNAGSQRSDLTTYQANAGTVPGAASAATFPDPEGNGLRRFVIQALYQAFVAQYGTDKVP